MLVLARWLTRSALFALICGVCSGAHGAVVYDESASGDFSNSGTTPTVVPVALGSNVIRGIMGDSSVAAFDRDYFSVTVPSDAALSALVLSADTEIGSSASSIAMQAGPQVTTFTASGLLGWAHYGVGELGTDILPRMAIPSLGSTGFPIPLGPGTYSFWLQDFDGGTLHYGLDLTLTAAAVPEPATYAALAVGLAFLIAGLRHGGKA